jgi:hypothetical protein
VDRYARLEKRFEERQIWQTVTFLSHMHELPPAAKHVFAETALHQRNLSFLFGSTERHPAYYCFESLNAIREAAFVLERIDKRWPARLSGPLLGVCPRIHLKSC